VRTEHGYRWAGAALAPDAGQSDAIERLLGQFGAAGAATAVASAASGILSPAESPSVTVAAEATGLALREAQRIVDALARQGRLVKVGEDLFYPPDRLDALMGRLAAAMETAGQLTLAEARDLLGTSRRYAQALLEHMDSEGLTLRVGEARGRPDAVTALYSPAT
jgi:hypothetical protein